MSIEKGRFIVFEGDSQVGTTHAERLAKYLQERGIDVVLTKDPNGISQVLPELTLVAYSKLLEDHIVKALLTSAGRRIGLLFEVIPALSCGKVVISDRFYGSTRIDQAEKGLDVRTIFELERLAMNTAGEELEPTITILLDIGKAPAQDNLKQWKMRREAYLQLAQNLKWEIIDASRGEDEVFDEILKVLKGKRIIKK